jgi:protein-tyrosine-phosphatase
MAHALFVCLHDAGRSQMSQALFERAAEGRHTAASAGTQPGERVHPEVVDAMRELRTTRRAGRQNFTRSNPAGRAWSQRLRWGG